MLIVVLTSVVDDDLPVDLRSGCCSVVADNDESNSCCFVFFSLLFFFVEVFGAIEPNALSSEFVLLLLLVVCLLRVVLSVVRCIVVLHDVESISHGKLVTAASSLALDRPPSIRSLIAESIVLITAIASVEATMSSQPSFCHVAFAHLLLDDERLFDVGGSSCKLDGDNVRFGTFGKISLLSFLVNL